MYDFTFNRDWTFSLVVTDRTTGATESYTGTYNLDAASPGPYPYLTLISESGTNRGLGRDLDDLLRPPSDRTVCSCMCSADP